MPGSGQIPSENPSGSAANYGEEAIARFVGEFLKSLGAEVEYEEIGPGRANVYGLWPEATRIKPTYPFRTASRTL